MKWETTLAKFGHYAKDNDFLQFIAVVVKGGRIKGIVANLYDLGWGHISEISAIIAWAKMVYYQLCGDVWSTAHKKVAFKSTRFLLVNEANSHDQLEPVTKYAWGRFSPFGETPIETLQKSAL